MTTKNPQTVARQIAAVVFGSDQGLVGQFNDIEELLENLNRTFHRLRQSGIDEELFDVVSGFKSLSSEHHRAAP